MASNRKLEESKKDMNFFSEFGGSGGQVGSYMSMILIIFLGFIVIAIMVYGVFFLQAVTVRNDIDALNAEMQSQEYQDKLKNYASLSDTISVLNQEYYDISYLFANIEAKDTVDSAYMDVIAKNLPKDIILNNFTYGDGKIILMGASLTNSAPLDLMASLSEESLFSRVEIDAIDQITADKDVADIDYVFIYKYDFAITCYVQSTYNVSISRIVDDSSTKALAPIDITPYAIGDPYSESGITTYTTIDGMSYTLSRVLVNEVKVSSDKLKAILATDSIEGIVTGDTSIYLYYVPTVTKTEVTK